MTELQVSSNGAHVLSIDGQTNRQTMTNAIAAISSLPNVEYVEEDPIRTELAIPNDTYYTSQLTTTATLPGLWGMWPVSAVAASAPGLTGSYGADFQTAWDTSTGVGVVVAVVDSGITPSMDIVGPTGLVFVGSGSNLASVGYDFITDCRIRGTCPATTANGAASYIAPSPNATDLGNFITVKDNIDNPTLFPAPTPPQTLPINSTWHGTHTAGTIAAIGNNNRGVIGGAYGAKILPVRVLGKGGGYVSDIAEGIKWAAGVHPTIANPTPAKVINISLGGLGACTTTEQTAIDMAVAAGSVVVVAVGNSGADVANYSPANCQNVISVAAIGRDGSRAIYSNFSSPSSNLTNPTNVTLAAQGGDYARADFNYSFDPGILSTFNFGTTSLITPANGGSGYTHKIGSSMAAPMVSAAAALMIAKNSSLTPAQIKTILSAPSSLTAFPSFAASSYPALNSMDCTVSNNCGAGVLNARLALQNTPATALSASALIDLGSVLINSSNSKTISFTNTSHANIQVNSPALVTGVNSSLFQVQLDGCNGFGINQNGSCQITVSYIPTAAGAHTATLSVLANGALAPTLVSLTGSAGTSTLTTSTPAITAAAVNVGQSTTVNLGFTNPNTTALKAGAVILSQPAIMATSADACSNVTLAAGASCSVIVTITPKVVSIYNGTASLGLSGGGAAALSTISGVANSGSVIKPSGGGGCSIMQLGASPDVSLLLAMLAVGVYWMRRRLFSDRGAD
jgi:serine protease